jgi:carbamoyl-phosphate synthase small subunit
MTYPHVGNTGINPEDMESAGIHMEGFIVKEYHPLPSNWRSRRSLADFLSEHGKLGVEGIDTRALTRRLRLSGAMKGALSTDTADVAGLLRRLKAYPGLVGRDLVKEVACRRPYTWEDGRPLAAGEAGQGIRRFRVAVVDCGVKYNILRMLEERGCAVQVFPAAATGKEILACRPDGILYSNGPGDPAVLPYIVACARFVIGKVPVFGICLGHQILGQAMGGKTEKLKFGHHGINQPVKNTVNGRIEITSQNHGFVVIPASVGREGQTTHDNLNDQTSEGLSYPEIKAFSVQYHPEAAPGPHDAAYLFDRFINLMKDEKR